MSDTTFVCYRCDEPFDNVEECKEHIFIYHTIRGWLYRFIGSNPDGVIRSLHIRLFKYKERWKNSDMIGYDEFGNEVEV